MNTASSIDRVASRRWLLSWGAALLFSGCHAEAVHPIVGPDGTEMAHVSCDDPGRCYQIAGQMCPHGYDIGPAVGEHAKNVLVRCRPHLSVPYVPAPVVAARRGPYLTPTPSAPLAPVPGGHRAARPRPYDDGASPNPGPRSAPPGAPAEPPWPPVSGEPGAWPTTENPGTSWPPRAGQSNAESAVRLDHDLGY